VTLLDILLFEESQKLHEHADEATSKLNAESSQNQAVVKASTPAR
jgi:hypothetical protein